MRSSLLITLEIALVLGVVVVLGGWDLWRTRQSLARDRLREAEHEARDASRGAASGTAAGSEPRAR